MDSLFLRGGCHGCRTQHVAWRHRQNRGGPVFDYRLDVRGSGESQRGVAASRTQGLLTKRRTSSRVV